MPIEIDLIRVNWLRSKEGVLAPRNYSQQELLALNQKAWDRRAEIHVDSEFYNVSGFLAGQCTLNPIELELLGDLHSKQVLHLQCHFGLDSLSMARRGAWVTGVDLSPKAIEFGKQLAKQTKRATHFICADVLAFGDEVKPDFDWVYTSYGVLCWLNDIDRWAKTVANALKPGGKLCLVEFHPAVDLMMGYGYFNQTQPDIEVESTYTENAGSHKQRVALWNHSLGEVTTALMAQGLVINHFQEYRYSPYNCFPELTEESPGRYVWEKEGHQIPLIYSLVATKT